MTTVIQNVIKNIKEVTHNLSKCQRKVKSSGFVQGEKFLISLNASTAGWAGIHPTLLRGKGI